MFKSTKLKHLYNIISRQKFDFLYVLAISFVVSFVDLLTKSMIFSIQEEGVYVCRFLNILKVKNFGISFGLFSENPAKSFYVIVIFEILITLYLLYSISGKFRYKKPLLFITSVAFIIGGAFGNIIDRIANKSVRDFIDVHIGSYHWPCFNIADIFVCIGVFLWIYCELFLQKKDVNG